jgi:hypothetical protein
MVAITYRRDRNGSKRCLANGLALPPRPVFAMRREPLAVHRPCERPVRRLSRGGVPGPLHHNRMGCQFLRLGDAAASASASTRLMRFPFTCPCVRRSPDLNRA